MKELTNDIEEKVNLEKTNEVGTADTADAVTDVTDLANAGSDVTDVTNASSDAPDATDAAHSEGSAVKANGAFAARLKAHPVEFVAMLLSVLLPVWSVVVGLMSNSMELVIDLTSDATRLFALYIVSWVKAISIPLGIAGIAINLIGVLKIKTKFVGFFDAILIAIFCLAIWHTIVLFGAAA